MKMKFKLGLALILTVAVIAGVLTGCSGGDDKASPSPSPEVTATPTPAPTPTPEPPMVLEIPADQLPLKETQKSDSIKMMQEALVKLGYLESEPNGFFGAGTLAAVKKFQLDNGLLDDGIVGSATIEKINEALAK
ncbi:MAG: peptidoglycan-binding domain-containing protein [Christensenellales bacterium]